MRLSHNIGAASLAAMFLLSQLVSGCVTALAQDPASQATEHGIDLYRRGNLNEAVRVLSEVVKKRRDDTDAWYYLGQAHYASGSIGSARSAFERVIELRPNSPDALAKVAYALILASEPERALTTARQALDLGDRGFEAHYAIAEASLRAGNSLASRTAMLSTPGTERPGAAEFAQAIQEADAALRIKPNFGLALITMSFAQSALGRDAEAAASLERFLALNPDDPDVAVWREQLEGQTHAGQAPNATTVARPLKGKDVTRKAHVLSKPEPQYTEAARKAGVTGTVVIRCVFSSTGEVTNLVIIRALGFGLTGRAAKAARLIKFDPALKDGNPVSMYMQLEYNFNLY